MDDLSVIVSMSQKEARAITEQIKSNLTKTRVLLLEMYEREGWRVLGYSSWREYGQIEFGYSESRIYQLMDGAKIERDISTIVEIDEHIPEGQLRPLSRIEPEQRAEIWQQAVETAPDGKITAAHVERVVDEHQDKKPHVSHNSGNNEWYTPPEIIEAARRVLEFIELDPATSEQANEIIQADEYITKQDDGLRKRWYGITWMNPPYDGQLIGKFTSKFIEHYLKGDIPEGIVLVNNATETRWFQDLAAEAITICFPNTRIKFWGPEGEKGQPLQGQAILYFGDNPRLFHHEFKAFGLVVEVV